MTANEKAKELIKRFGKKTSIEIAEMILEEHKQYCDPYTEWRAGFRETYTNAEKTKYWGDVKDLLNISDVIGSSIPKPPDPPKDRILREDGKGLVPPKNYR